MAWTIGATRDGGAVRAASARGLRWSDGAAAATLAAVLLLAFAPWWAGGLVFAPLDVVTELYEPWASAGDGRVEVHNHFTTDGVTQVIPYLHLAKHAFESDGQLGWSSWTWGGRPEYANTSAPYADWTTQLLRVTDVWTAWHLGLMAQLALAALGMLLFLRARGLAPDAALLGSLAYTANSQFVLWLHHRWQLAAFCWIPWLAWSLDRARRGCRDAIVLVPVFVALSLLGGSLQTNAFTGLVLAVLGGHWAWQAGREEGPRGAVRALSSSAGAGLLGAALAAPALLPEIASFLANVGTGHERGAIGYAGGPLEPLLSLGVWVAQLAPSLTGSPDSLDLNRLLGRTFYDLAYFGTLPVALAYLALLRGSCPREARWLMALGLLLPLTPLVGPLYHRVQLLFVFGGTWAFAHAWQGLSRERADMLARRSTFLLLGVVLLWALASGLLWLGREPLVEWLQERVRSKMEAGAGLFAMHGAWMLERAARLPETLLLWSPRQLATLAGVALGILALAWRARRSDGLPAALLAFALCLELGVFAAGWLTLARPQQAYPWTGELLAVRDLLATAPPEAPPRLSVQGAPGRPPILTPNLGIPLGFETLESYESIRTPGMWLSAGLSYEPATLGLLGVSHALTLPDQRPRGEGWARLYAGRTLSLWRNEHALPRYQSLWSTPPAERAAFARQLREAARAGPGLRVLESTPSRRLLALPREAVALRVAENHAAGWRARTLREDGSAGPWRPVEAAADGSWLIRLLPRSGESRLELRYDPPARTAGRGLALGAAGLTLALALRPGREGGRSGRSS